MSFIITPSDLHGLTERQLRAKRVAILTDLAARGLRLEDCPHIAVSIRFIDEALARVARFRLKPPGP
ncbi:hypothetical protein [uncultured Brevundimonas sp.]|uniref:hypothetical protein n=1 Tax=uncultured Brevundimonas sp. TaxID=213418 RepID=UPI00259251E1|nr:hypothetical protein [uncultured Brevundimonas sp.]